MTVLSACLKADFPVLFVDGELTRVEQVICFLLGIEVVYIRR